MYDSAKSEHQIQKEIQLAVSKHHCKIFRVNVGKGYLVSFNQIIDKTPDGNYIVKGPLRYFDTGVPKGYPDLCGFRELDGKAFYIEVKTAKGRPRDEQKQFHRMLTADHVIHGIARSAQDALMIVDGGLIGYGY